MMAYGVGRYLMYNKYQCQVRLYNLKVINQQCAQLLPNHNCYLSDIDCINIPVHRPVWDLCIQDKMDGSQMTETFCSPSNSM